MTQQTNNNETLFVSSAKNIHQAILEVMRQVEYVQKKKSGGLTYTFASEADLIAALRPHMVASGIYCYVLAISDFRAEQYETAKGTKMINTTLQSVIRYVHAPSETFIDTVARGEGADYGDKSGNKSQTCSFKYSLRETFCLETGDDPDKDASVERAGNKKNQKPAPALAQKPPASAPEPAAPGNEEPAKATEPAQPTAGVQPRNGDLKISEITLKDGKKIKLSNDSWSPFFALGNIALTLTNAEDKKVINGTAISQKRDANKEHPKLACMAIIEHVKKLGGPDLTDLAKEIYDAQSHLS